MTLLRYIILAVLLMSGAAGAYTHVRMDTITVWPYNLRELDSLTVNGDASTHVTLTVNSMTVLRAPATTNLTDVWINIDQDTVSYGASGGGVAYFFIDSSSGSSNHTGIKIWGKPSTDGGVIRKSGTNGDETANIYITRMHDCSIKHIRWEVDGRDANNIEAQQWPSFGAYNILFENNEWVNKCTVYTSREAYDGAVVKTALTPVAVDSAAGRYYILGFYKDSVLEGHSVGFHVRGFTWIDSCYFLIDAYNGLYVDSFAWGSAPIGKSWANSYAVHFREGKSGARLRWSTIRSGTSWYGCRGIFLEKCNGSAFGTGGDSVYIHNNDVRISEGPYMEALGVNGSIHVLRVRDTNTYFSIANNYLEGTFDKDAATTYASEEGQVAFLSITTSPNPRFNFRNNRVVAKTGVATGTETYSFGSFVFEGTDISTSNYNIGGNYFESAMRIFGFGDNQNYIAGFAMRGKDTLAFGSTTVTGFKTLTMGRSSGGQNSLDDTLQDLVYLNGASPYDVTFNGTGLSCEYFVQRTATVTVLGNNGYPVPGATVRIWNKYGDTTNVVTAVGSGTTDANGKFTDTVLIHYESDDFLDSLNASFVPFYAKATIAADQKGDTSSVNYTVSPSNWPISLTLPSTAGTPPAGTVKSFKGVSIKGTRVGGF